jgi:hypothetical protein
VLPVQHLLIDYLGTGTGTGLKTPTGFKTGTGNSIRVNFVIWIGFAGSIYVAALEPRTAHLFSQSLFKHFRESGCPFLTADPALEWRATGQYI